MQSRPGEPLFAGKPPSAALTGMAQAAQVGLAVCQLWQAAAVPPLKQAVTPCWRTAAPHAFWALATEVKGVMSVTVLAATQVPASVPPLLLPLLPPLLPPLPLPLPLSTAVPLLLPLLEPLLLPELLPELEPLLLPELPPEASSFEPVLLLLLLQPVKVERPKATERVTMEAGMKRLRMVGADDVPQEYGRVQSKC
jgi:hypothetical protein